MQFLDATTDLAFKKLFGDPKHSGLTIDFLNHILNRKPGELITHITHNNTENLPLTPGEKGSFLYISCTDEAGSEYMVEMQHKDKGNFKERAQFYVGYALAKQVSSKVNYKELIPVIFVGVLGCSTFLDTKDYLTHHRTVNTKTGKWSLKHSEYHFIELEKFHKNLEEVDGNVADQWIYLIKNSSTLKNIPKLFGHSATILEAFEVLEFCRLSAAEREIYIAEMDSRNREGNIETIAREKGEAIGRAESKREIAKELLKEFDITKTAQLTGLSVEELELFTK